MALLFFYLGLAIGVSFLCSVLEAVLLSVTPSFVTSIEREGRPVGRLLESLKADVDRPLAAILSLNTIAHTVGAAGVGAQAQVVFQSIPVTVISAVLTLLILVLSEIIPKTVGAVYWRRLVIPSAYCIQFLTLVLWPLVVLSRGVSRLVAGDDNRPGISREELKAIADLGQQEGVIDRLDALTLRSVMRLSDYRVADILTPRVVAATLPTGLTVAEGLERLESVAYSRIPVMEPEDGNRPIGYVLRMDLMQAALDRRADRPLDDLLREAPVVPDASSVKQLYQRLLKGQEHLAVVIDEFGNFAGIVTLEDVLETLIGQEIVDEADIVEDLRDHARRVKS
ncbi:MAG: CNNM domain-containing protein [Opitutales bacterium]